MGKVGYPQGLLRGDSSTARTRTQKEINLDAIREKLAYDLYLVLGGSCFHLPKTRLSELPLVDQFKPSTMLYSMFSIVQNSSYNEKFPLSLRIMSRYIDGYQDFKHARSRGPDGNSITFMEFLEITHRPPTHLLTPNGKEVPLKGFIEMVTAGRILADTDILGGYGTNAGFIWVEEDGEIVRAETVKIDPGCAFNFKHDERESSPSPNWVLNTHHQLFGGKMLKNIKDLQLAQNFFPITLHWDALTCEQKEMFLTLLLYSEQYLQKHDVLEYLFYRDGLFYKDDQANLPEAYAEQLKTEMREWLYFQLEEVYNEDLELFQLNRYSQKIDEAIMPLLTNCNFSISIEGPNSARQKIELVEKYLEFQDKIIKDSHLENERLQEKIEHLTKKLHQTQLELQQLMLEDSDSYQEKQVQRLEAMLEERRAAIREAKMQYREREAAIDKVETRLWALQESISAQESSASTQQRAELYPSEFKKTVSNFSESTEFREEPCRARALLALIGVPAPASVRFPARDRPLQLDKDMNSLVSKAQQIAGKNSSLSLAGEGSTNIEEKLNQIAACLVSQNQAVESSDLENKYLKEKLDILLPKAIQKTRGLYRSKLEMLPVQVQNLMIQLTREQKRYLGKQQQLQDLEEYEECCNQQCEELLCQAGSSTTTTRLFIKEL